MSICLKEIALSWICTMDYFTTGPRDIRLMPLDGQMQAWACSLCPCTHVYTQKTLTRTPPPTGAKLRTRNAQADSYYESAMIAEHSYRNNYLIIANWGYDKHLLTVAAASGQLPGHLFPGCSLRWLTSDAVPRWQGTVQQQVVLPLQAAAIRAPMANGCILVVQAGTILQQHPWVNLTWQSSCQAGSCVTYLRNRVGLFRFNRSVNNQYLWNNIFCLGSPKLLEVTNAKPWLC